MWSASARVRMSFVPVALPFGAGDWWYRLWFGEGAVSCNSVRPVIVRSPTRRFPRGQSAGSARSESDLDLSSYSDDRHATVTAFRIEPFHRVSRFNVWIPATPSSFSENLSRHTLRFTELDGE